MEKVSYDSVVGILMYVMAWKRLYIIYVLGFVSRYMENPRRDQIWKTIKRIFKYLQGKMHMLSSIKEMEVRSFIITGLLMSTNKVM